MRVCVAESPAPSWSVARTWGWILNTASADIVAAGEKGECAHRQLEGGACLAEETCCRRHLSSNIHLSSGQTSMMPPVQWRARFGSGQSRRLVAQRRSSAAGCSPLRRCPKPEFYSFEGWRWFWKQVIRYYEQMSRQIPTDTGEIGNNANRGEEDFWGCWTLMCWEG